MTEFTRDQIKHMVDRFLQWKLPTNFAPDGGISFKATFNENTPWPMTHEPVGTNLFDATQAEAMVRNMIEGLPAPASPDVRVVPDEAVIEAGAKALAAAVKCAWEGMRFQSKAEYPMWGVGAIENPSQEGFRQTVREIAAAMLAASPSPSAPPKGEPTNYSPCTAIEAVKEMQRQQAAGQLRDSMLEAIRPAPIPSPDVREAAQTVAGIVVSKWEAFFEHQQMATDPRSELSEDTRYRLMDDTTEAIASALRQAHAAGQAEGRVSELVGWLNVKIAEAEKEAAAAQAGYWPTRLNVLREVIRAAIRSTKPSNADE